MFQVLKEDVVERQNKGVHLGHAANGAVSGRHHATAAKGPHRVESAGLIGQDRAWTGPGIRLFVGRIAAPGTHVSHAVDRYLGNEPIGMRLAGKRLQTCRAAGALQVSQDPKTLECGHGDVGRAAVGAIFLAGQVELTDTAVVDGHHLLENRQFVL